jgi:hypothetical protein
MLEEIVVINTFLKFNFFRKKYPTIIIKMKEAYCQINPG